MEQKSLENKFFTTQDEKGNKEQFLMVKHAKIDDGREFGLAIKLDRDQLSKMENLDGESVKKTIKDVLLLQIFNRPSGMTAAKYLECNDDYQDILDSL